MSRHRQVEARLADVGLHAVNRLASGGADHFGIKQLDDIWSGSRWAIKKKNNLYADSDVLSEAQISSWN